MYGPQGTTSAAMATWHPQSSRKCQLAPIGSSEDVSGYRKVLHGWLKNVSHFCGQIGSEFGPFGCTGSIAGPLGIVAGAAVLILMTLPRFIISGVTSGGKQQGDLRECTLCRAGLEIINPGL